MSVDKAPTPNDTAQQVRATLFASATHPFVKHAELAALLAHPQTKEPTLQCLRSLNCALRKGKYLAFSETAATEPAGMVFITTKPLSASALRLFVDTAIAHGFVDNLRDLAFMPAKNRSTLPPALVRYLSFQTGIVYLAMPNDNRIGNRRCIPCLMEALVRSLHSLTLVANIPGHMLKKLPCALKTRLLCVRGTTEGVVFGSVCCKKSTLDLVFGCPREDVNLPLKVDYKENKFSSLLEQLETDLSTRVTSLQWEMSTNRLEYPFLKDLSQALANMPRLQDLRYTIRSRLVFHPHWETLNGLRSEVRSRVPRLVSILRDLETAATYAKPSVTVRIHQEMEVLNAAGQPAWTFTDLKTILNEEIAKCWEPQVTYESAEKLTILCQAMPTPWVYLELDAFHTP